MPLISLFVLVQLLGPDGQPVSDLERIDGRMAEGPLLQLEPGLHQLTAGGQRATFFVPEGPGAEPLRLQVNVRPLPGDFGVAIRRHRHVDESAAVPPRGAVDPMLPQALGYELGPTLPETIRVARYADNNCSSTFLRVDEVPLESYVAGVVNAEIGVFAAAGSGEGVQIPSGERRTRVFASFQTFAVAARTYVVWWYLRQGPAADYHIKDGPCNQVYKDDRTEISTAAATSTAGQILVAEFDHNLLDKHEYASACARRGSLPSYKSATPVDPADIIPDDGLSRVCVRDWCGHDRERMAHQDNPLFPAGNRSLVRGICQWGSVERAVRGDSYLQILSHYQPLLTLRTIGGEPQLGGLAGELTAADSGAPVVGAQLLLSLDGEERSTRTDRQGQYEFAELSPGLWQVHVRAEGYQSQDDHILVEAGSVRYAHFQLVAGGDEPELPDAGPVPGAGDGGSIDPPDAQRDAAVGCGCGAAQGLGFPWWTVFLIGMGFFGPLRRGRRRATPPL